jgi:hypothetical protein
MKIEYDKLIIERIILELRFSHGFLYWDNCGKIWKNICEKWVDLKMIEVTPDKAIFNIQDQGLQLKFSQKDIHLSQDYPPSSLKLFKEVAKEAIPLIANFLEIRSFSRIGNRIFYLYTTANLKEAEDIIKSIKLLSLSDDKIKSFGDNLSEPRIGFKIQNEDVGYTFNISSISRTLNVELPKPLKVDSSKFITDAVVIDVDYFTRKSVDLSLTDFADLINIVQKNLKHNLTKLLS